MGSKRSPADYHCPENLGTKQARIEEDGKRRCKSIEGSIVADISGSYVLNIAKLDNLPFL